METGSCNKNTKNAVVYASFIFFLLLVIIYWSKTAIKKAANRELGAGMKETSESWAVAGKVNVYWTRRRRLRRSLPLTTVPIMTLYSGAESASAYMVDYGYDQVDRTIFPTIFGPVVVHKRRFGYRHGPYYGYGAYEDAPPFFGHGDVKNGLGVDLLADLRAAVALNEGRIVSSQILPTYMQKAKS